MQSELNAKAQRCEDAKQASRILPGREGIRESCRRDWVPPRGEAIPTALFKFIFGLWETNSLFAIWYNSSRNDMNDPPANRTCDPHFFARQAPSLPDPACAPVLGCSDAPNCCGFDSPTTPAREYAFCFHHPLFQTSTLPWLPDSRAVLNVEEWRKS